jgi:hypothetical protein
LQLVDSDDDDVAKGASERERRARLEIAELRAAKAEKELKELKAQLSGSAEPAVSSFSRSPAVNSSLGLMSGLRPNFLQFSPAELQVQQQVVALQLLQQINAGSAPGAAAGRGGRLEHLH